MYEKGEENIADSISRNCTPNKIPNESDENEVATYANFFMTKMAPKSISDEDVKMETPKDISLVAVNNALNCCLVNGTTTQYSNHIVDFKMN